MIRCRFYDEKVKPLPIEDELFINQYKMKDWLKYHFKELKSKNVKYACWIYDMEWLLCYELNDEVTYITIKELKERK